MSIGAYTSIRQSATAICVAVLTVFVGGASQAAGFNATPAMKVLGTARTPIGYAAFCAANPGECLPAGPKNVREELDIAKYEQLDRINREINIRIAPMTDAELYGTAERWSYPVDRGDCEDYVLLKRKTLIEAGWDASALLITVVRDEKGAGHAVLTVATDRGDLVLDNQRDGVLPWQATGYDYVKRQSQTDPKLWVYVGPVRADTGVATAR